jgi:hypothetical protein
MKRSAHESEKGDEDVNSAVLVISSKRSFGALYTPIVFELGVIARCSKLYRSALDVDSGLFCNLMALALAWHGVRVCRGAWD